MASNHTQHLGLSQWEAEDEVLRADFNADNARIDAAVGELRAANAQKAEASALNALTQTVAGKADATALSKKGNCAIVTGSYVGNGGYGFTLNFDAPPVALFIVCDGYLYVGTRVGTAYETATNKNVAINTTWEGDHLKLQSSWADAPVRMNVQGKTYFYFALVDME